jgi:hypothetical protein
MVEWNSLLSLPLPMSIPRLESQKKSAETTVFCGDAGNVSKVDVDKSVDFPFGIKMAALCVRPSPG